MSNGAGPNTSAVWPANNREFLELLFGDEWGRAHLCAIFGDPSAKEADWSGGQAEGYLRYCWDGSNNYYTVSLFTGPKRRASEMDGLYVLGLDDVGVKVNPEAARGFLGEPTYQIETSPSNYQWGYRLAVPLRNRGKAKALIHALRVLLTGQAAKDPGQEGVTRYLRLPFGRNGKASLGRGRGVSTRLVDGVFVGRVLSWETLVSLAARLKIELTEEDQVRADQPPPGEERPFSGSAAFDAELFQQDVLLRALDALGLIIGGPRDTPMGRGYDLRCPWHHEHTERSDTGTFYAPVGKFKCQHGHCSDRHAGDLRVRLNELLLEDSGGLSGLAAMEFSRKPQGDRETADAAEDEAEPAPSGEPAEDEVPSVSAAAMEFLRRIVVLEELNKFYDLKTSTTYGGDRVLDSLWRDRLRRDLPVVGDGRRAYRMEPSEWLLRCPTAIRAQGFIHWPGEGALVLHEGRTLVNLWRPLPRPLKDAPEAEVDARAVAPWLELFWHVVRQDSADEWAIGETILDWMAMVLGAPALKGGWHVVITGEQRLGKELPMRPLEVKLGDAAGAISPADLHSQYDPWQKLRLGMLNEANQTTRGAQTPKDQMSRLKVATDNTKEWLTVREKYVPNHRARNVLMLWITSNEKVPLRLDPSDRRFLVLDRHAVQRKPTEFYTRLVRWLEEIAGVANGYERVAEFLFRRWERLDHAKRQVLTGVAPWTPDKEQQLEENRDEVEVWLGYAIREAVLPDVVAMRDVYHHLADARRKGEAGLRFNTPSPHETQLGEILKKAGAVKLNEGKQLWVGGRGVRLWAVRNGQKYLEMGMAELKKAFSEGNMGFSDDFSE